MTGPDCDHIPTAPGQTMCRCQDNRMFLELLIRLQAEHIAQLQRRLGTHHPHLIEVVDEPHPYDGTDFEVWT